VKDQKELLALTGLRFVAAFYVFVFHIHIRWPVTDVPFLKNLLGQGAVGMSLFFILSGFVLAYRYADETAPLGGYFANRFGRIYPIYAVAALVTLPFIGISWGKGSISEIGTAAIQGLILVMANIFLIQAWFPQFFDYWNDGGSWSISVEAFCYVLLPFLLPTMLRLSPKQLLLVAFVCWMLATLPGLVGSIFPGAPRVVYYATPIFRLPEFMLGVCSYLAFRNGYENRPRYQWALPALIVLYLGVLGPVFPNYIGHNWIVVPAFSYLVFSLAGGQGGLASILSNPLIVWLGRISYCFYSFQAIVILSLTRFHDRIVSAIPSLASNKLFFILAFSMVSSISVAGYYLIEEPGRRKIGKLYAARTRGKLSSTRLQHSVDEQSAITSPLMRVGLAAGPLLADQQRKVSVSTLEL
jgi:peptidoglycan/LPS O-acetylase OafA/YrhL